MTDTWTVIGSREVRGHKPGETFDEAIPERQAQRLLRSGALEKAGKPAKTKGDKASLETTESASADEASDASGDKTKKEE